jgi:hypothetical protein
MKAETIMNKEEIYKKIKTFIKQNTIETDLNTFQPVMKISLEIPLEFVQDNISSKECWELIGKAISEK